MVAYHPPNSKAVVDLPDSVVDRYVAAGWVAVEKPKSRRKSKGDDGE